MSPRAVSLTPRHIALCLTAVTFLGACTGQVAPPAGGAVPNGEKPPDLVAAPSAAVPRMTPSVPLDIVVRPQVLRSLSEARAAYGFPIVLPTALPAGYQLSGIELFKNAAPSMDVLHVRYASPDGHYVEVRQGDPLPSAGGGEAYRLAPTDSRGTATIDGQTAAWVHGFATSPTTWHPGPLTLMWKPSAMQLPGATSGYQIESDALSVDELVRIAESVAPV